MKPAHILEYTFNKQSILLPFNISSVPGLPMMLHFCYYESRLSVFFLCPNIKHQSYSLICMRSINYCLKLVILSKREEKYWIEAEKSVVRLKEKQRWRQIKYKEKNQSKWKWKSNLKIIGIQVIEFKGWYTQCTNIRTNFFWWQQIKHFLLLFPEVVLQSIILPLSLIQLPEISVHSDFIFILPWETDKQYARYVLLCFWLKFQKIWQIFTIGMAKNPFCLNFIVLL